MKSMVDVLVLLATVSFAVGVILKLLDASLMGMIPVAYWRFTMGCLAFAITLLLRDLARKK